MNTDGLYSEILGFRGIVFTQYTLQIVVLQFDVLRRLPHNSCHIIFICDFRVAFFYLEAGKQQCVSLGSLS